jgi:hypothetical protein
MLFWSKQSSKSFKKPDPVEQPISLEFEASSSQFDEPTDFAEIVEPTPSSPLAVVANKAVISQTRTKRQDELRCEIDLLNGDLVGLMKRKNTGHITVTQEEELKSKRKKKESLESELKKKKKEQERQKKSRVSKREKISKLCQTHPEVKEALKLRGKTGRPRIEIDQPLFLKAIVDIALHGSAAHEKRRSDVYRSIKTLDDLTDQLKSDGFMVSYIINQSKRTDLLSLLVAINIQGE